MKFSTIGLQRSGTNYTESFLAKQGLAHVSSSPGNLFDAPFHAWKHWASPKRFAQDVDTENHIIILVTKHPLKWLESILRNPVDITFAYPYLQYGKHQVNVPHSWRLNKFHTLDVEKLLKHYNTFQSNWLNTDIFAHQYVARYEDMIDVEYANQFVEDICYEFNMPFTAIPTRPTDLEMSADSRSKEYLDTYKKGQYNLPENFVELSKKILDSSLLERLNYQF